MEFGQCQIISLWLSGNKFSSFPKCILNLRRIGCLDISSNEISEIPADFVKCRYIACLELAKNRIQNIPTVFKRLKHLRRFSVEDNLLTDFPVLVWLQIKPFLLYLYSEGPFFEPKNVENRAKRVHAKNEPLVQKN